MFLLKNLKMKTDLDYVNYLGAYFLSSSSLIFLSSSSLILCLIFSSISSLCILYHLFMRYFEPSPPSFSTITSSGIKFFSIHRFHWSRVLGKLSRIQPPWLKQQYCYVMFYLNRPLISFLCR